MMQSKFVTHIMPILVRSRIISCKFATEPGVRREHEYVFKKVRNDSIIREFALGLIVPQLLKFPDSLQADTVVKKLVDQLDCLPTDIAPSSFLEQLKAMGLFGAIIPPKYGGLGLCMSHFAYLLEHRLLVDWVLTLTAHQTLCAQTILYYGSEEQKGLYLPRMASGEMTGAFCLTENSSGSEMAAMETVGVLNAMEDHYVVDGTKNWVVNGAVADIMIVFVLTEDSRYEGGREHMTALIVDKTMDGISVAKPYNVNCLPNSHLADVLFHSVFVPITNVLFEDNGGYKIANHIQNSARCMVGPSVTGWLRILIQDLVRRDKSGVFDDNSYLRHLVNDSVSHLYAIESTLFFTTRYADLFEVAEVDLESAAVKVFSTESAKIVVDNYLRILALLQCNVPTDMSLLCDRVSYLQSFLGSNYFVRLYIGGTMTQLSEYTLLEIKEKLRSPISNLPSLIKFTRSSSKAIDWSEHMKHSKYSNVVDRTLFLKDLADIYMKMQLSRMTLFKIMQRYKEETMEHQHVIEAMSDVGILMYVVSCCVARANTNNGDFEMRCTHMMIDRAKRVMDMCIKSLKITANEDRTWLVSMLADDITAAGGYASADVLTLKESGVNVSADNH